MSDKLGSQCSGDNCKINVVKKTKEYVVLVCSTCGKTETIYSH